MVNVEVVLDSISPHGIRLTTLKLTYPKFVHAELMTHRVFSRNAGSSRAIPVKKLLRYIRDEPAEPIHWGLNEKGMQSRVEATGLRLWLLKAVWRSARRAACRRAWLMDKLGGHKQIVNRIVESHGHINVLVSSTYWENFFALRDHPDADPVIRALAHEMKRQMANSAPRLLMAGEWHLPYIVKSDEMALTPEEQRKVSAARCARVSYLTVDGKPPGPGMDLALYYRLAGGVPIHASPLEHQATPDRLGIEWENRHEWGNFYGWRQFRKLVAGESTKEVFEQDAKGARGFSMATQSGGESPADGSHLGVPVDSSMQHAAKGYAPGNELRNLVTSVKKGRGSNGKVGSKKGRRSLPSYGRGKGQSF